jgi:CubicO group peptidase (beta-lactamase class C family)
VDGVLDFAWSLLDRTLVSRDALQAVQTRHSPMRTVGFEAKHPGWSGGDACSEGTIGHTGFTGTGLWIDFERGLAWTLLTNRVHPTRHRDTGIVTLRRETSDRVIAAFDRAGAAHRDR